MQLILRNLFAFALLCTAYAVFPFMQSAKTKCNGVRIKEDMQPLRYKSAMGTANRIVEMRIFRGIPLGSGVAGTVFIGYTGVKPGSYTLPPDQCVAVKIYDDAPEMAYDNAIEVMEAIIEDRTLGHNAYEHIVRMYDHGQMLGDDQSVIMIMELGDKSLDDEIFFGTKYQKMTTCQAMELAWDIMVPLEELHHGVSIYTVHIDVKPDNLLLFPSTKSKKHRWLWCGDEKRTLKLADVDASTVVHDPNNVPPNTLNFHPGPYYAPECFSDNQWFPNPKMDIWAAGAVILEAITASRSDIKNLNYHQLQSNKKIVHEKVKLIAELFANSGTIVKMGDRAVIQIGDQILDEHDMSEWWSAYLGAVMGILDMWIRYPEVAVLIMYMMHPDPVKRLSAKGVLDYLDGQCRPAAAVIHNHAECTQCAYCLPLIGTVLTTPELRKWMDTEIALKQVIDRKKPYVNQLKLLRGLLPKIERRQKKLLNVLTQRQEICDAS